MIHEIADSEDELDFISPPKVNAIVMNAELAMTNSLNDPDQLDPLHETLFDEFLTPTQRLSSYDGGHDNPEDISASNVLDSSTDRFLKALATSSASSSPNKNSADPLSQQTDHSMGGKRKRETPAKTTSSKKRSRTLAEVDEAHATEQHEGLKRRSKTTYGSSSTADTKSGDALDFNALMRTSTDKSNSNHVQDDQLGTHDTVEDPSRMVSIDARTDYTSPLDLSLHLSASTYAQAAVDRRLPGVDKISANSFYPSNSYTAQNGFFGTNLAGGMASKSSIGNYQSFSISPARLGMDFDKINPFGSLSQVSLPGDVDSDETRGIADIFRIGVSHSTKSGAADQILDGHAVETGPSFATEDQTEEMFQTRDANEEVAQCSPPFSQITNTDDLIANDESLGANDRSKDASASALQVKPPSKKRGRKPKKAVPDEVVENSHDVHNTPHEDQPVSRSTRAGTVDSVSNASEISQSTTGGKGRKRKSTRSEMGPPDLQSKKLPSSDLGLDNKDIIGLSPERYVPRLSRRRGRGDSDIQSHVAPPASGSSQVDELSIDHEDPPVADIPVAPTPVKGKRGRKAKVKRAKTSAAALLKKHDDFLDDDEKEEAKEVIFMDERPAKIKFDPLPEFDTDKKPKMESPVAEDDAEEDDEITKGNTRRMKISVDIPILPKSSDQEDLPSAVPESKKRGRKRKKPVEEQQDHQPETEEQRPALAEKDTNIQSTKSKDTKSANQIDEDDTTNEKENAQQEKEETPLPSTKDASVTTPRKAAATPARQTHSPLKPMSSTPLFNARARIGLSKRHSIPSLLRRVNRDKEAPKTIERKEKLSKWQLEEKEQERIAKEEAEAEGREYKPLNQLRGKDGLLVEWDF